MYSLITDIQELLDCNKDVSNPNAKDLSSRLNEDDIIEWMNIDSLIQKF